jgi:hypothetical protein
VHPELCGDKDKSKTIVIDHFGADPAKHVVWYLLLRSWMIHRLRRNGFSERKSSRRKLVAHECARLKKDILALGGDSGVIA